VDAVLGSSLRGQSSSPTTSLASRTRAFLYRIPNAAHGNDRVANRPCSSCLCRRNSNNSPKYLRERQTAMYLSRLLESASETRRSHFRVGEVIQVDAGVLLLSQCPAGFAEALDH
jgi:hypothetical protein